MVKSVQVDLIKRVAEKICLRKERGKTFLIGVDGLDGAGKTIFTKKLANFLTSLDIDVVHTSVDFFHNPSEVRYQKGKESPYGFYHDSYDYKSFLSCLISPIKCGFGTFKDKLFDCDLNKYISVPQKKVNPNSILLVDGIFLFRPELSNYWDFKILLEVGFNTSLNRNLGRLGEINDEVKLRLEKSITRDICLVRSYIWKNQNQENKLI